MKIWCVEDDTSIRDIEIYTLTSVGYTAVGFCDAEQFFDALKSDVPNLIILDIMLPKTDGVAILRRLKSTSETASIPVIMATAKGMEYDKIQSLDLGADDYLVKPFGMMEMVSRVKAVLRRSYKQTEIIKANGIILNLSEHSVAVNGELIKLTYKEFELLKLLMTNIGVVFSRERLFIDVWGSEFVGETRTVDVHIRTLRQKLSVCGNMIETIRNVGYRMEVPYDDR